MARNYLPFALATLIGTGQTQAATPDLQGIWARVSFPGFGSPFTGPGPVVMKPRGADGRPAGYTNPILKPQAAEIVRRHGELESKGIHALSPRTECWPTGVPLILANSAMQMIQRPDKITILYSETYEVRQVRINQPHPRARHAILEWRFRWTLRRGHAGNRHDRDQGRAIRGDRSARHGRSVGYATQPGASCRRTVSVT
jgi:hypothetical protein